MYRRSVTQRGVALERLRTQRFDVLVVGGGIIGAGIAEAASRHGFRVALVERDDFSSGTSSASSKLVHGGLRYLRLGHFSLIREALAEVHALSRVVAPHLVTPLNFVLPVYRGGPYGRIPIRGALWSYAGLTGAVSERGRMIAPAAAAQLVPPLRLDGLRAAGLYPDAQTDDARLCLANLRGAVDAGAVVVNRVELAGLERGPLAHVRDACTGETFEVRPRAVVNATGPWLDEVRRLEDARAGTSVTLSRGAHLVLERVGGWGAAVTIPIDRTRVAFAVPWAGSLLVGTTDSAFEGDARSIEPTEAEERQILDEAGLALEAAALGPVRGALRGHPSPAGGGGRDCTRSPRDDALLRAARDGLGRRRQADHVPPDRARGAAPAPVRARAAPDRPAPAAAARRRRPRRRGGRAAAPASGSRRTGSRRTWPARTAASPTR